jgi:hypothetical protein
LLNPLVSRPRIHRPSYFFADQLPHRPAMFRLSRQQDDAHLAWLQTDILAQQTRFCFGQDRLGDFGGKPEFYFHLIQKSLVSCFRFLSSNCFLVHLFTSLVHLFKL